MAGPLVRGLSILAAVAIRSLRERRDPSLRFHSELHFGTHDGAEHGAVLVAGSRFLAERTVRQALGKPAALVWIRTTPAEARGECETPTLEAWLHARGTR